MRTFPRALDTFRELVNERGRHLRSLSFSDLEGLVRPPMGPLQENVTVDSRAATIVTIVERREDGRLRVVLHGTMEPRSLPIGHHVAMDGFYKHPDDTVSPMPEDEFYEFD